MAKKRAARKSNKFTLPLAVIGGFAPLGLNLLGATKRALAGDLAGASQEIVIRTTGYNTDTKSWNGAVFAETYVPILAGFVVHKLAGRLGVNRAIAKAGVPILRI